jgi:hypothetical protein
MTLTIDKARIAQQFAWERRHSTTQEQIDTLDSMIERLAITIFGSRSRVQRSEFLRFAKYRQPLDNRPLIEQYASLVQETN